MKLFPKAARNLQCLLRALLSGDEKCKLRYKLIHGGTIVCMYVSILIALVIRVTLVLSVFKIFFSRSPIAEIAILLSKNKHCHDIAIFGKSLRHEILSVFKVSNMKLYLHSMTHTKMVLQC